ncbi:unnamed protein product [Ostreobium quekettii]|uniref:Uncharacterized protein n=1 Tax=Ostreobium quekettii TaxID=121088 RepID=A0A8S1IZY5_9CHLO|nr:unnamed protein product [Ostreobium quekettii]
MGLKRKTAFSEITSDPYVASKLEEIYGSLDDIDPYLGGLAEDHVNDSNLGELFYASMSDQYTRLRDGDRFYFENGDNGLFTDAEVQKIRATGLRDVIMRNTNIKNLPQSLYFRANDDVWPRA